MLNFFVGVLIVLISLNGIMINCLQLSPDYCFDKGECSYSVVSPRDNPGVCRVSCGDELGFSPDPSCYHDEISFAASVDCFVISFGSEWISGDEMDIYLTLCNNTICGNEIDHVKVRIYETPKITEEDLTFSVYDIIEHEMNFYGSGFDAFFNPYLIIHLRHPDSSICQVRANCSAIDSTYLKCNKPKFPVDCLPPSEHHILTTDIDFYSHGKAQPKFILNHRSLRVYRPPIFYSFTWDQVQKKFFILSNETLLLLAKVFCIILGEPNMDQLVANLDPLGDKNYMFELPVDLLRGATLNCSIQLGDYHFLIGQMYLSSNLQESTSRTSSIGYAILWGAGFGLLCLLAVVLTILAKPRRQSLSKTRAPIVLDSSARSLINKLTVKSDATSSVVPNSKQSDFH